jgi:predicted MPP superfamily phosphohydrolase
MAVEKAVIKPLLKQALRITGLYGRGIANVTEIVVTERQFSFPDLPREFDGLRILHLSDLHIDSLPELADAVARTVRGLEADLCVMTGDYRFDIEGPCDAALTGMETVISALPDCPLIGTLGNHDPCEIAAGLEALGVQLLINEATVIRRGGATLTFAGTDDSYDYKTHDLEDALAGVSGDTFRILLAHTPDLYAEAARAGVRLYLCGHTHGGQIRLPLLGSVIQNADAPRAFTRGPWRYAGMRGYTSSGVGCSMLPVRFNCPPEIGLFELTRSTASTQSARSRPRLSVVQGAVPRPGLA